MNSSIEYIANFKTSLDPYNGITILSEDLPKDILEFEQNLKDLIQNVKDNKNLIWIYIDIEKSDFIPIATKVGFTFHSCNSDYILLVKVLKENAIVPNLANHTLMSFQLHLKFCLHLLTLRKVLYFYLLSHFVLNMYQFL